MRKNIQFTLLIITGFMRPIFSQDIPLYFGVNLAGAEFGQDMPGIFDKTYTYPTSSELDYYLSKGLKLIRLPFKWERMQLAPGDDLNQAEIKRMRNFIQEARNRKMFVILDLHNYGRYKIGDVEYIIGSEEVTKEHISNFWNKMASVFKNETNIYGYGIMNEPHDMLDDVPWIEIAQEIITEVRLADTSTNIIVGGDSWSSAERWLKYSGDLKSLVDPYNKIIYEAHTYFDKDASGRYSASYEDELANDTSGVERVKPFVDWLKMNNFRGFIGEYGIPQDDTRWLITLENFLSYISSNGINGTYWAGGPWWGSYPLSVEPNGGDKPQMSVLEKFTIADTSHHYIPVYSPSGKNHKFFLNNQPPNIYPNPFSTELTICNTKKSNTFRIFNLQGKLVMHFEIKNKKNVVCVDIPQGIYFLRDEFGYVVKIFKI